MSKVHRLEKTFILKLLQLLNITIPTRMNLNTENVIY